MIDTILNDVVSVLQATFLHGDWRSLAVAFGSVVIAALLMRRGTQIFSMTIIALILFAIGGYLLGVLSPSAPADPAATSSRFVGQLESSWAMFMQTTAANLLAYFIAFMALIIVLFGVKSVLSRG